MDGDDPAGYQDFEFDGPNFTNDNDDEITAKNMPAGSQERPYFSGNEWDLQNVPTTSNGDVQSTVAPASLSLSQTAGWNQQMPESSDFGPMGNDNQYLPHVDLASPFSPVGPSASQPFQFTGQAMADASVMTPGREEELMNIAMPPNLRYSSPKSSSSSSSVTGATKKPRIVGKTKVHKTHNVIEKRYRTKLNDMLSELRDSVPSLRIMSKSSRGEDTTGDQEELHGLTPAHKLNKATVLTKAIEYIRHLEKRNSKIADENSAMKARLTAFEKLFTAGAMNGSISTSQHPPTPLHYPQDAIQPSGSPALQGADVITTPRGMIEVPDDMKRIISAQMAVGRPYPVPQQPPSPVAPNFIRRQQIQQQRQAQQGGNGNGAFLGGPYFGKFMVGTLAGLMILEAVREDEASSESTHGRGLFAFPVHWLGRAATSAFDVHVMGYRVQTSLRLVLALGVFLWIFVPSLFSTSDEKPEKETIGELQSAPSLASPIHVRRQAWQTAIQTVWVPRRNIVLEVAALALKTLKLSIRNTLGPDGYQVLSGITPEQETSRISAWSIALDSQLAGGDIEINKSRLLLTLLASGTLPSSPYRLMLKALHIRVLLWDLGRSYPRFGLVDLAAAKIARSRWDQAREVNQLLKRLRPNPSVPQDDELPSHLEALVELECDDVLNRDVIQRAYNLACNNETAYRINHPTVAMDNVVVDSAVGTPLDAVAAWWSTQALDQILGVTLAEKEDDQEATIADVGLAMKTAPIGSIAKVRAIVARAFLVNHKRGANIAAASHALGDGLNEDSADTDMSMIESVSYSTDPDLRLALRCATAIAHLERRGVTVAALKENLGLSDRIVLPQDSSSSMSLLGFTAAFKLMEALFQQKATVEAFQPALEDLAAGLRLWIGGAAGELTGVGSVVRSKAVERCLAITKALVGMEVDTGYGSLSENDDERYTTT